MDQIELNYVLMLIELNRIELFLFTKLDCLKKNCFWDWNYTYAKLNSKKWNCLTKRKLEIEMFLTFKLNCSKSSSSSCRGPLSPLLSIIHRFWQVFRVDPVSSHTCCVYVRAGRPAFAWPYAGVHRSTSLMSSSLLLQQCPACLVRNRTVYLYKNGFDI